MCVYANLNCGLSQKPSKCLTLCLPLGCDARADKQHREHWHWILDDPEPRIFGDADNETYNYYYTVPATTYLIANKQTKDLSDENGV